MIYKKVVLDGIKTDAFIECYVSDKIGGFKRKAILVIPGGAMEVYAQTERVSR